jgi:hypothetical protein
LRHVLILLHTHIHAGGAELCEVGHADNLPGKKRNFNKFRIRQGCGSTFILNIRREE